MDDRARLIAQLQGQPTAPHAFARAPVPSLDDRAMSMLGADPTLAYRGTILPVGRTAEGGLTMAWPQFAVDMARSAALPRHAAEGGEFSVDDVTRMGMDVGMLGSVASVPRGAMRMGGGMVDDATDGIIRLTDDAAARLSPEERLRIAQHNAAQPVEAGGLGLPPDNTPQMRAQAMGFDTDAYHATRAKNEFSEFRPGARGSIYMAATPEGASRGAAGQALENPYSAPGEQSITGILPLKIKSGDVEDLSVNIDKWNALPEKVVGDENLARLQPDIEAAGAKYWDDVYTHHRANGEDRYYRENAPSVRYQDIEPGKNVFGYRLGGYNSGSDVPSLERAARIGKKGFMVADEAGSSVVAGPDMRIRSRFAAFDPARSASADLLAANTATPLQRLYAMMQSHDNATRDRVARETLARGGT